MLTTRLTFAAGAALTLGLVAGCSSSDDPADVADEAQADVSAAAEDVGEAVEEALDDATGAGDDGDATDDGADDSGESDAATGESGSHTATVAINGETYNFAIPADHDGLDAQCLALDGSLQGYLPLEGAEESDSYVSFAFVDWDAVSDAELHNPTSMSMSLPDGTEWVAGEEATWFGLDNSQLPVDVVPSFDDAGSYASGTLTLQMVPDIADPNAEEVFADATVDMTCMR